MRLSTGGRLMKHTNEAVPNPNPLDSNPLEQIRDRFELWRRDHPGRHRLPQELWSAAANIARQYGVNRTARTLRLSYDSLKEHMPECAAGGRKRPKSTRFVELLPWSSARMPECSVELENARGAKIKIQLHGAAVSELSHLTLLFWREL
jgi:hypothetical protein